MGDLAQMPRLTPTTRTNETGSRLSLDVMVATVGSLKAVRLNSTHELSISIFAVKTEHGTRVITLMVTWARHPCP